MPALLIVTVLSHIPGRVALKKKIKTIFIFLLAVLMKPFSGLWWVNIIFLITLLCGDAFHYVKDGVENLQGYV